MAATDARDRIAAEKEAAAKALAELDLSEREKNRIALAQAEQDGRQIADQMAADIEREMGELAAGAQNRMDNAVNYLLKKVQETA